MVRGSEIRDSATHHVSCADEGAEIHEMPGSGGRDWHSTAPTTTGYGITTSGLLVVGLDRVNGKQPTHHPSIGNFEVRGS